MPPLMPDEDKNFGGSLVFDFTEKVMTSRENDLYHASLSSSKISENAVSFTAGKSQKFKPEKLPLECSITL